MCGKSKPFILFHFHSLGCSLFSFPNFLFEVSGNNLDCSCSLPFPDMSDLSSSSATPGIVSCQSCIREALKNGIF